MSTSRKTMRAAGTSLRFVVLTVGAIVMILPFAYMVSTAFKPQAYVLETPPKFIPDPGTVDNFVQAWTTQDFSRYALNSAFVSVTSTVLAVWLSSMMAYAFARFDFPGKEWFFRALLLGLMIPSMMLIIPQFVLTKQLHLIDNLWALVLFYVSGNLALNTFLLRSFFEGIPRELDEAMEVDGANVWTRYWCLAMPLARPGPRWRRPSSSLSWRPGMSSPGPSRSFRRKRNAPSRSPFSCSTGKTPRSGGSCLPRPSSRSSPSSSCT